MYGTELKKLVSELLRVTVTLPDSLTYSTWVAGTENLMKSIDKIIWSKNINQIEMVYDRNDHDKVLSFASLKYFAICRVLKKLDTIKATNITKCTIITISFWSNPLILLKVTQIRLKASPKKQHETTPMKFITE